MIRAEMMHRMSATEFVAWALLAEVDFEDREKSESRVQTPEEQYAMLKLLQTKTKAKAKTAAKQKGVKASGSSRPWHRGFTE